MDEEPEMQSHQSQGAKNLGAVQHGSDGLSLNRGASWLVNLLAELSLAVEITLAI